MLPAFAFCADAAAMKKGSKFDLEAAQKNMATFAKSFVSSDATKLDEQIAMYALENKLEIRSASLAVSVQREQNYTEYFALVVFKRS